MSSTEAPAHGTDAGPIAAVLDEAAGHKAHNPGEPSVNGSLRDGYRGETDSGLRICDRVSMTAEFTDAHRATRLDAAPYEVTEAHHIPQLRPADPITPPTLNTPERAPVGQHDSDVLQARRFIELLDDELAELQSQATTLRRRAQHGTDKHLGTLATRMNEVQAMRDALHRRFPTA